jgi:hypothetical protein
MVTVLGLDDPSLALLDHIFIDTSVLLRVRSHSSQQPGATSAAVRFLNRIQARCLAGTLLAVVSTIALEECYYKLISRRLETDPVFNPQRATCATQRHILVSRVTWHDLYKSQPRCVQQCAGDVSAFARWVQGIPLYVLEPSDLRVSSQVPALEERMRFFIDSAQILPKDAYLIAEAERIGIFNIATLDSDFARLDTRFTVYTTP